MSGQRKTIESIKKVYSASYVDYLKSEQVRSEAVFMGVFWTSIGQLGIGAAILLMTARFDHLIELLLLHAGCHVAAFVSVSVPTGVACATFCHFWFYRSSISVTYVTRLTAIAAVFLFVLIIIVVMNYRP